MSELCSVENCGRKHSAHGYCNKHYHQIRYHGQILERTINDPNEIIIENDICRMKLYNKKQIVVAETIFYLKYKSEVERFTNCFEWDTEEEKIFNFVKLFGLEKAGYWNPFHKEWDNVGFVGYVNLSRVYENDSVFDMKWDYDNANINRIYQRFPSPFLAFEDC